MFRLIDKQPLLVYSYVTMSYEDRMLARSERDNEIALERLRQERDAMSLPQKIRHLGVAVDLSNKIARLEGMIRERRRMYGDFPPYREMYFSDDEARDTAGE